MTIPSHAVIASLSTYRREAERRKVSARRWRIARQVALWLVVTPLSVALLAGGVLLLNLGVNVFTAWVAR